MSEPGRPPPLFVVGIGASATPREAVQADHVYGHPSDALLTVQRGLLEVKPRTSAPERPLLVDRLFSSLAAAYGEGAIGIVLSGAWIRSKNSLTRSPQLRRRIEHGRMESRASSSIRPRVRLPSSGQTLKTARTLLVWRAIGGDLHDVRVVLAEPGIDARRVCL